ncbi:B12-binding domain-containing radical SAM protein [Micromonospora siamensis]|uniref:Radical SAM superfamily enzyme YgiQ, UPF0313 family n=1 Tax=Micromonospora siamensis TaxID=299152 RepID=A0A1C5HX74_9ACTN|nr:radical SAM protein [Micromonospora siamensis]SCG50493.1 Radical SAM superfamily enzyme YgiQ, UPF0313 family [Micromonospora siamensis]
MTSAVIVQLPFPSTAEPDPHLTRYYADYDATFRADFPEYFIPQDGLWEMPLWVAHLTALVRSGGLDSRFCDLSRQPALPEGCAEAILADSSPGDLVLISPLAQNLRLALHVAPLLRRAGRKVVLGGNMAPLVDPDEVDLVHRGQLTPALVGRLVRLARGTGRLSENLPVLGKADDLIDWVPDYRHLDGYRGQVPLLRLNASHGCLYRCSFCGDAWTRQLILVHRRALEAEVDRLTARFPEARLFYIGDKTFGQSPEAVANLIDVFADRPGYRFIVQTHVMQVRPAILEQMQALGVAAVELGFESGDSELLKRMSKLSRGLDDYGRKVRLLHDGGLRVVLNVMGGLDEETEESHAQTVDWLWQHRELLWLFNLYNFVPYPLVPDFARLRPRIFDWDFANWREDAPPVYRPRNLTPARSWELFQEKVARAGRIVGERLGQLT